MNQRLLILRPQPGADRTAVRAREAGFLPVVFPLFEVKPLAWNPPEPTQFDAIMLTSANSLRHGGPALRHYTRLPAMCVGAETARAARQAGFAQVNVAGPDSRALLEAIEKEGYNCILHLCGHSVQPLPDTRSTVTRLPVYKSVEAVPTGFLDAIQPGDIALLHSPRAAALLGNIVPVALRAHIAHVAISPATLQAAGSGWATALAASTPDDGAILALARKMCQGLPSDNNREPEQ